jgi:hypothetical protein
VGYHSKRQVTLQEPCEADGPGPLALAALPIHSIEFKDFGSLSRLGDALTLTSHMPSLSLIETSTQRRSAVRYRLHLPVIFHWNEGTECTEGGFTYDVAVNGALISSTRCPPIGSDIRIEVLVPSPADRNEQLRIQCVGKVTRAVNDANGCSFGVRGIFDDDHIVRQMVM